MFRMIVEDVFAIRGRGVVTTGRVEAGQLRVGGHVRINDGLIVTVTAIEAFRKKMAQANPGDNVGLVFADVERSQLSPGDVLTSPTMS
jgi:translation elongation factor EF-Tu-like GTPase